MLYYVYNCARMRILFSFAMTDRCKYGGILILKSLLKPLQTNFLIMHFEMFCHEKIILCMRGFKKDTI